MSSFRLNVFPATIASGQSQSGSVYIDNEALAGVFVPAGSALTQLSFLGSLDNSTFFNIYSDDGTEYTATVAAGNFTVLNLNKFLGVRAVKLRAGIAASGVSQTVAQTVQVVTKEV